MKSKLQWSLPDGRDARGREPPVGNPHAESRASQWSSCFLYSAELREKTTQTIRRPDNSICSQICLLWNHRIWHFLCYVLVLLCPALSLVCPVIVLEHKVLEHKLTFFLCYRGSQLNHCLVSQKKLWTFKQHWECKRPLETFEIGLNLFCLMS